MAQELIEAPITGKIISVNVKVGDEVKEGDVLCLLESMKMENPILAPVSGTITQIEVSVDQVVKPGEIIAIIDYQKVGDLCSVFLKLVFCFFIGATL